MPTPDLKAVERRLESSTGLDFDVKGRSGADGVTTVVRPLGFERLHGFVIEVDLGWHSVSAKFVPDTFAGDIVGIAAASSRSQRDEFSNVARGIALDGVVLLEFDGRGSDASDPGSWPLSWDALRLVVERGPLELNASTVDRVVAQSALSVASLIFALLPIEVVEPERVHLGHEEGAQYQTSGKAYERSPANRAACIALKGSACAVCGLEMARIYGPMGEGYIQVHHALPVAEMGQGHVVDIESELFPLCPNCHAMVHRQNPPMTVEALRDLMETLGGR